MSSIDERIVDMKFNNGQFEQGVKKTMGSLDALKKGLNLDGAKKSLAGLSAEGKKFNLQGVADGISGLASKFSTLSIVGITALASIANKAIAVGAQMAKSLTIDPILAGFQEYELKMGSIQTILANTEAQGTTLDDVSASLSALNDYADKTIYNFGDMTRNIGLFTNAGIGIEDATSMIQGFSNAAAASGTSSQGAAGAAYQLSQALSAGTIRLMDWRSLTNVGMGNKNMQNSLIEIAEAMGVLNDKGVTAEQIQSDFNGSLEKNWLSADVMSTYLKIMAGDMDAAAMSAVGLSDTQIAALQKQQKTAEEAATKVRTWTQLIGTLQESVGSSWAQTSELLLGDFDEATEFFTEISDTLGALIGAAGNARNNVLSDWKDLGGRTQAIKALRQGFKALMEILAPIKEAFVEIFPPATGQQLFDITVAIKNFMKSLRPTEETVDNLKRTFKGLFAIFDIGWMVIKGIIGLFGDLFGTLDGAGGGLLNLTGNMGDWIVSVRDALKEGKGIQKFFKTLGNVLKTPIELIKALAGWVGDLFNKDINVDGLGGAFELLRERLEPLGAIGDALAETWPKVTAKLKEFVEWAQPAIDAVKTFFKAIGDALGEAFSTGDFSGVLDAVNTGLLGGIVLLIKNFLDKGLDFGGLMSGGVGVLDSIKESFGGLTGVLSTMQNNLKADTLMKLAAAIGILTASVILLSLIDGAKLATSLTGLTVMMGQLMGAMVIMEKFTTAKGAAKMSGIAVALGLLATALLILSAAVKVMSTLSWEELAKGLGGIAVALGLMIGSVKLLEGSTGSMFKAAAGLTVMAVALKIMASAVKDFSGMDWEEMAKGFAGVAAAIAAAGLFGKLSGAGAKMIGSAAALLILGVALKAIASAVGAFAEMDLGTLGKGMGAMAVALLAIGVAMNLMPKTMILSAAGLLLVSVAISSLAESMQSMGGMSWEEIGKSMVVLAGSLAILAGAMALMGIPLVLLGSVGLLAAAAALTMLAPALILLSGITWEQIGTGLGILAASLGIMAVLGVLLIPASVGFLALGAALVLIGTGVALAGAGVAALAVGLTALAVAGAAGAGAIIILGKAVISLIPELMKALGEGLVQMVGVIAENGTAFISAGETLIGSLLTAINNKGPEIIDTLFNLIMSLVDQLEENVPKFVDSGLKMINGILEGIAENIPQIAENATLICTNFLDAIGENVPKIVDAGMQMVVDLINGIADAISENSPQVDAAIQNLITAMKDAFIGSVSSFTGIGGDIIGGIVSGINGGLSSVIGAASNIATSALNAAKSALGIASPSKEFAKLGVFSSQGFAKGLRSGNRDTVRQVYSDMNADLKNFLENTRQDLASYRDKLDDLKDREKELNSAKEKDTKAIKKNAEAIREVSAAIKQSQSEYDKAASARRMLINHLDDERARLGRLADKYETVNKKLEAARQKLSDARAARDDYNASIKDQYSGMEDITAETKLSDFTKNLKDQVEKTNEFRIKMKKLDLLGLNDTMYKKLMAEGVEALPFIDQVLKSGKSGVKDLNVLSKDLGTASSKLGSMASKELYQAGVDSALGLVEGLKKQKSKIQAQMTDIAAYMVKEIKKRLGIKSPSREFAKIGVYSGQGLAGGLKQSSTLVNKAAQNVGTDALSTLKKTLSNMDYAVDGGLNLSPTITPVLDLTEVQKGAGDIQNALTPSSITPTSSYGKAASIAQADRSAQEQMSEETFGPTTNVNYTQNITSPKAVPESEIYRNSNNMISTIKKGLPGS